jgi:hypothetical protein
VELSGATGVKVELVYAEADRWSVFWADGPTRDQAAALVADLLDRFPAMADRRLSYGRHRTPRACAARAVAAARTGDLAERTSQRLAYLADLGMSDNPHTGFTAAEHALLAVLEDLVDTTGHPDRPTAPEDQALIEQLLTAADGSEHTMAQLLLRGGTVPSLDNLPDDELAARRRARGNTSRRVVKPGPPRPRVLA